MTKHVSDSPWANCPFFNGLSESHSKIMNRFSRQEQFEAGTYIFREGQAANSFYILGTGRVAVEIFAAERGPITTQTLEPGDVLGWSWLIPPHRWRFAARSVARTKVIALDGKALREECEKDHEFGYQLLSRFTKIVAERLEATRLQVLDLYGA
jgi:CRP/FNR family transcriptional regulator, cyclic AMP receptor protein